MSEPKFVEELAAWWEKNHLADFPTMNSIGTEVPYKGIPRAKCDLVLSTDSSIDNPEWAIEVKHIALVGNNGKNNDFGVAKILSPYLKDRSLIHDILRLRDFGIGRHKAVVGYCFEYSFESCFLLFDFMPGFAVYVKLRVNPPKSSSGSPQIFSKKHITTVDDSLNTGRDSVEAIFGNGNRNQVNLSNHSQLMW
jgi:hypothetical protein